MVTLVPSSRFRLPSLTPVQQLKAGRLPRRLIQLYLGLCGYGFSMAMMIKAELGLPPWDVLHQGMSHYLPVSFGVVTIVVGGLVLLLWIPLRQWPGLGTISNVFVVGIAADVGLALLPAPGGLAERIALLTSGLLINGFSGAAYIGSHFGAGPRDGLMTGLHTRTGWSIRLIRTGIELTVLGGGFLLGGTVGIGTVLYALTIGPLVQLFLPLIAVRLTSNPTIPQVPENHQ